MSYYCAQCNAPAKVSDQGKITRTCTHAGKIIAPRSAVLYGEGGAADSVATRARNALARLIAAFR